jgi:endo-1,4-beta-xylanase
LQTRREMTASVLGTVLGGTLSATKAVAASGLSAAASRRGRFFGSAVRFERLQTEPALRGAVLQDCAVLTPEVELKWDAIEPAPGKWSLTNIDGLVRFALETGKAVRGHTLLWHRSTPAWAEQRLHEQRDWRLIARHFAAVIPRHGDAIAEWDVVNEPIETGYRWDGLRRNVFLEAFGPDYIRRALVEARALAPRARLMLNEYSLEYDSREERDRRYLFLKLVEGLRRSGAPLDGIGLQGHLDLRKGTVSTSSIAAFVRELAGMGLTIVVTELDVKEAEYTAPADRRDRMAADEVRRYLDAVLAEPSVTGIMTWGLSDRHSWLEVLDEDYRRFPGAWQNGDGPGLNRGLPYDSAMRRKPMYAAIEGALQAR